MAKKAYQYFGTTILLALFLGSGCAMEDDDQGGVDSEATADETGVISEALSGRGTGLVSTEDQEKFGLTMVSMGNVRGLPDIVCSGVAIGTRTVMFGSRCGIDDKFGFGVTFLRQHYWGASYHEFGKVAFMILKEDLRDRDGRIWKPRTHLRDAGGNVALEGTPVVCMGMEEDGVRSSWRYAFMTIDEVFGGDNVLVPSHSTIQVRDNGASGVPCFHGLEQRAMIYRDDGRDFLGVSIGRSIADEAVRVSPDL